MRILLDYLMFRNLLSRLFGETPDAAAPLSADDAAVAIAALMVRVARADNHYTRQEQDAIDAILVDRMGGDARAAAERRAAAEMIEAEAPDTVRFTRIIKDRIALEHRFAVIRALWLVALSDGHKTPGEDAMVRLTAGLLGVNDRDSALARQEAARRLDLPTS